jgi:hypothetical protein
MIPDCEPPEFTAEQEASIQKRIESAKKEAALLEQLTIAEDTIRRDLIIRAEQMVAQGVWHPFLKEVARTMYSSAISRTPAAEPESTIEPQTPE